MSSVLSGLTTLTGWGVYVAVRKVAYSSLQLASPLRKLTCHMGSHSVTCHLTDDITTFTQLKLVLDLATPEGCKAELTQWPVKHRGEIVVYSAAQKWR